MNSPQEKCDNSLERRCRRLSVGQLLLAAAFACGGLAVTVCWPPLAANLFAADGQLDGPAAGLLAVARWVLLGVSLCFTAAWLWARRRRPRPTPLRLAPTLAVVLGMAAGLAVAELACRVANRLRYGLWFRSPIPFQPELVVRDGLPLLEPGYYSVPVRDDFTRRTWRVPVYINRFGLKGPETTERKRTRWRILCVGGSTTYGWHLGNAQSYPARLQALLDRRPGDRQVEVLNAGVPAYAARHVLAALKRRWLRLDPDLIIYYGGYNDLWRGFAAQYGAEPAGQRAFRPTHGQERSGPAAAGQRSKPLSIGPPRAGPARLSMATLLLARPLANWLARRRAGPTAADYTLAPTGAGRSDLPLHPKLLAQYRRDLESLVALCRSRHIGLVLATFASSWDPDDRNASEPVRWARAAADMPWVSAAALHEAMVAVRRTAADVAKQQHVPLLRAEQRIPAQTDYFYDTIHLSPAGAERLASLLDELLASDRRPLADLDRVGR